MSEAFKGFAGYLLGEVKKKLLQELDNSDDVKAEALIMSLLSGLLSKIDLPKERKKRLVRLLRDAVARVYSGM